MLHASMRSKTIIPALALALLVGFAAPVARAQIAIAPNEPAPELIGFWHPSMDREVVDWSETRLTLVTFWADWCEPCKSLMPRLQELHEQRADEGLRIIGVYNPAVTTKAVTEFLRPLNVSYPIMRQSKLIGKQWGVTILPTSFLVDPNGTVMRRYAGAKQELMDALIDDTNRLLDGRTLETMELPGPQPVTELETEVNPPPD
jgi:thiol-disulfide isomerase/thioredoxin